MKQMTMLPIGGHNSHHFTLKSPFLLHHRDSTIQSLVSTNIPNGKPLAGIAQNLVISLSGVGFFEPPRIFM